MKEQLRFIKNLTTKTITVRNRSYPVQVNGSGKIPFLSIGIGSHLQMTLPTPLTNRLKIYSTDLYWIASQRKEQSEKLTIEHIVDDIIEVISQLRLSECLIAGFSCFGILALEAAKRKDPRIKGVVLVSTPPGWDQKIIAQAQIYFDQKASLERKLNDAQRKEHFLKIKKPNESLGSVNAYAADAARYWRDFNLSQDFFNHLWQDIQVDDAIINHFFSNLLPQHDLRVHIDEISVPVVLFSGRLDFDSIPLQLWKAFEKPANFVAIDCGETGHWPQLEEPAFFTHSFENWLREQKMISENDEVGFPKSL